MLLILKSFNRFIHPMDKLRKISVSLLSVSSIIGIVRGYRIAMYPTESSVLFPYPEELINTSVFSNHSILGWIVFFFVGIFSIIAMAATIGKIHNYAYLIIVEGIFASFLTLTHMLVVGFSFVHLLIFPLSLAFIVVGIQQTPKEF